MQCSTEKNRTQFLSGIQNTTNRNRYAFLKNMGLLWSPKKKNHPDMNLKIQTMHYLFVCFPAGSNIYVRNRKRKRKKRTTPQCKQNINL